MPMHQPTIRRRESHAAMRLGWGDMARSPAVANPVDGRRWDELYCLLNGERC